MGFDYVRYVTLAGSIHLRSLSSQRSWCHIHSRKGPLFIGSCNGSRSLLIGWT